MFQSIWAKIILCTLAIVALGTISGLSTASQITTWYAELNKPSWNPPSWIFAPMWTTLYIMMGIAFARVWHTAPSKARNTAMGLFVVQLLLNLIWTPVFFGMHQIGIALIIIITLAILIVLTIRLFMKIDNIAGYLLIPYLLWVSFASFLNFTIYQLNI